MKTGVCPNCGHYMQSETEMKAEESFNVTYYHCDVCDHDATEEHDFIAPLKENSQTLYHYSEEI